MLHYECIYFLKHYPRVQRAAHANRQSHLCYNRPQYNKLFTRDHGICTSMLSSHKHDAYLEIPWSSYCCMRNAGSSTAACACSTNKRIVAATKPAITTLECVAISEQLISGNLPFGECWRSQLVPLETMKRLTNKPRTRSQEPRSDRECNTTQTQFSLYEESHSSLNQFHISL